MDGLNGDLNSREIYIVYFFMPSMHDVVK